MIANRDFIDLHARPGAVGLVGGPLLVDRLVRRAQRRQTKEKTSSPFSHAFIFGERRADGHWWVIESDIDLHRASARIGVQENRADKYYDPQSYDALAVLDFGLKPAQAQRVIAAGLELVATRAQYSLREILALYVSLKRPAARTKSSTNVLAQERALFCSALVQHLYSTVGIDFQTEVDTKLTSPEDIFQTPVKHTRHVLVGNKAGA